MARKPIKNFSGVALAVLLMLGIILCINLISAHYFIRTDLTENKEYSLAPSTKKVLAELNDIVNINCYFSENLSPELNEKVNWIKDLFSEYQAYANNKLSIEYIDPGEDEDIQQQAMRKGIRPFRDTVIERDKFQERLVYLGIEVQYGDKSEIIQDLRKTQNFEYNLTSALYKASNTKEPIIGWIGPRERDETVQGYSIIQKFLDEEFLVRSLEPETLSSIPQNMDTLIVRGNQNIPERGLYAIDQYLMGGGKIIFLTDGVELEETGLSASAANQSIDKLLEHYGINVRNELVVDKSFSWILMQEQDSPVLIQYPFWPRIIAQNFNKDYPPVNQLDTLFLTWVSPINVNDSNTSEYKITKLMTSSKASKTMGPPFDLNPRQDFNIAPDNSDPPALGLLIEGKFSSYFADKPIPDNPQKPVSPNTEEEKPIEESPETRIIVIGSTSFISNQFFAIAQRIPQMLQPSPGVNIIFFQNIVDSLTVGNHLIGIRSRAVTSRNLDYGDLDDKGKHMHQIMHRLFGIALVPFALVIFGIIRLSIKSKRKKTALSK